MLVWYHLIMSDPEVKKRKTTSLKLTRFELLHIRDVLSVMLPSEMNVTVSQALAKQQQRTLVEARLWDKIKDACERVDIPLGDDAPDFVVAASSAPSVDVFELAHDGNINDEKEAPPISNVFDRLVNEK